MNRSVPLLILIFFMVSGCSRNVVSSTSPPVVPPVVQPYQVTNEYDAAYYGNNGSIYYTYAYHIKDTLYDGSGGGYHWSSLSRNATDTFYNLAGQSDAPFGQNKSCVALISNIDTSQQKNYSYYIGSYYKFSLFNDTTVGNLQFMIPTDSFPSVDSIPVGHFLNFYGGLQSFYTRMARAEVKITSGQDFVQTGDSLSYANPLVPATGAIDSVELHIWVTRFSDNGIHPNAQITKTMDASYWLYLYFHDGSRFSIINGKLTNLFFQKAPM